MTEPGTTPTGRGLPRRRVLALTTLVGAGALLGAAELRPSGAQAATAYRPTFARLSYSGDPSASTSSKWAWQGFQGDVRRPTAAAVPAQYLYATAVRRPGDPEGVTQCLRPADVPSSWLLRTRSGTVAARTVGAVGDQAIDVGLPAFRTAAAAALVARCKAGKWSGVLLDEVNGTFSYGWPGAVLAKYPTDESWQEAVLGFVTVLAAALKAAGFTLVGNLAEFLPEHEDWNVELVAAGLQPSCEVFLHGHTLGGTPATGYAWEYEVQCVQWAAQNAARVVVLERQTDLARIRYSLCSVLLVDNGRIVFGSDIDHAASTSMYPADYTRAIALGAPTGDAVEPDAARAAGLFTRSFAGGRVVVNSRSTALTLSGTTYGPATGTIELR